MADSLSIGRHWFHSGKLAHYDIPKKRINEIESLCVHLPPKQLLAIIKNKQGE